jgi:hypothetical protein
MRRYIFACVLSGLDRGRRLSLDARIRLAGRKTISANALFAAWRWMK